MAGTTNGASRIGRTTVIRGSVRGDGDVEIEGRIEGVVAIEGDVSLADSARVRIDDGALSGRRISVRGAVAGSIRGSQGIVLEEGARVVGDLAAPTIGIRPGGLLRGHVTTSDAPESQALTQGRADRGRSRASASAAASRSARSNRAYVPPPRVSSPAVTQRTATPAPEPEVETPVARRGRKAEAAPPPVMPALRKGQRGQMKKKAGK